MNAISSKGDDAFSETEGRASVHEQLGVNSARALYFV